MFIICESYPSSVPLADKNCMEPKRAQKCRLLLQHVADGSVPPDLKQKISERNRYYGNGHHTWRGSFEIS